MLLHLQIFLKLLMYSKPFFLFQMIKNDTILNIYKHVWTCLPTPKHVWTCLLTTWQNYYKIMKFSKTVNLMTTTKWFLGPRCWRLRSKTGGGDQYASLALVKTIRLYLSFLSGNSVSLFCLRFTLRNRLFRNSLKICRTTARTPCWILWFYYERNKGSVIYIQPRSIWAHSRPSRSTINRRIAWIYPDFAQTSGSLQLSLSTTSTYSLGKFYSSIKNKDFNVDQWKWLDFAYQSPYVVP